VPITRVAADTALPDSLREMARLVIDVRKYARALGTRLYRSDLYLFDDWLAGQGGDLTRAVLLLQRLLEDAEGEQAFERMRRILEAQRRSRSMPLEPLPADSATAGITPPPVPR
jgi:hypothetical protein